MRITSAFFFPISYPSTQLPELLKMGHNKVINTKKRPGMAQSLKESYSNLTPPYLWPRKNEKKYFSPSHNLNFAETD